MTEQVTSSKERAGAAEALLKDSGALLEGHFQLASGKHSPIYVEKFRLLERPAQTEALCAMIAAWARDLRPQVVAGPTTGGIIISYEVARLLSLRGIFAEKVAGQPGRAFERGFTLMRGERVLVVDDVLTTGGSVRDVLDAVKRCGAETIGVAVLVDRSAGAIDFGVPLFSCLALELPTSAPDACPLCERGVQLKIT